MKHKAASDIFNFFTHLQIALMYAKSHIKDYPGGMFTHFFRMFVPKIEWIYTTIITAPQLKQHMPQTIDMIKEKYNGEVITELALKDKITFLSAQEQEMVEAVVDSIINGEKMEVVEIN
jgi:hypothetical protein